MGRYQPGTLDDYEYQARQQAHRSRRLREALNPSRTQTNNTSGKVTTNTDNTAAIQTAETALQTAQTAQQQAQTAAQRAAALAASTHTETLRADASGYSTTSQWATILETSIPERDNSTAHIITTASLAVNCQPEANLDLRIRANGETLASIALAPAEQHSTSLTAMVATDPGTKITLEARSTAQSHHTAIDGTKITLATRIDYQAKETT